MSLASGDLADVLRTRGVKSVALVDDAYDCPSGVVQAEWISMRLAPANMDPEVHAERIDQLGPVDGLRRFLRGLDLEVLVFGRDEVDGTILGADLWFFDLFWSLEDADEENALSEAVRQAKKAFDHFGQEGRKLPFVVLMSSNDGALGRVKEKFAGAAEVPDGCFAVLSKRELRRLGEDADDPADAEEIALLGGLVDDLERKIRLWTANPDFRSGIFSFARAVRQAADLAKEEFVNAVRRMTVGDYAYILKEGISDDGHPLGDYLLWMLEPLFVHHLHSSDAVRRAREALDVVTAPVFSDGLWPNPSVSYAEILQHRFWKDASPIPEGGKPFRLHRGDLLEDCGEHDERKVWLVISPACDLARLGPKTLGRSVYLLPGVLADSADASSLRIFLPENRVDSRHEPSTIQWSIKEVVTRSYAEIPELNGGNIRRRFCLRRKYTLALVHKWSSWVTRIGLPVEPPLPKRAKVVLRLRGESPSIWVVVGSWPSGCRLSGAGKRVSVTLGPETVHAISDCLGKAGVTISGLVEKLYQPIVVKNDGALPESPEVRVYLGQQPRSEPRKVLVVISLVEDLEPLYTESE